MKHCTVCTGLKHRSFYNLFTPICNIRQHQCQNVLTTGHTMHLSLF